MGRNPYGNITKAKVVGKMKDLKSSFKLEHFGYQHIRWNQFSNPFTKGQQSFVAAAGT